jgi:hypothetical protein
VDSIVRAQLSLTLRYFSVLLAMLVGVPLFLVLVPGVQTFSVLHVPFVWLALGAGFFPMFLLLAKSYVRAAERLEARFVEVVERR